MKRIKLLVSRACIFPVVVVSACHSTTVADVTNNSVAAAPARDVPTTPCLWQKPMPATKCKAVLGHIIFVAYLSVKDPGLLTGLDKNGNELFGGKASKIREDQDPVPPMPGWYGSGPADAESWRKFYLSFRDVQDMVEDQFFDKLIEMAIKDYPAAMVPYLGLIQSVLSLTGDTMVLPQPVGLQQSIADMHDLNQVNDTIAFTQKGIDQINYFVNTIYGPASEALSTLNANLSQLNTQRDYLIHNPGAQTGPGKPTGPTISAAPAKSNGAADDHSGGSAAEGHATGGLGGARVGYGGTRDSGVFKGDINGH